MTSKTPSPWLHAAIVSGLLYVAIGYGSAAIDPSVPDRARFLWRLTAWVLSAAVFAAHIGYERVRLNAAPRALAAHVAAGVALGAFLLAGAATAHAATVAEHAPYWKFMLALVLWPVLTALPAFVVALAAGAGLAALRHD